MTLTRQQRIAIFAGFTVLSVAAVFFLPPIAQPLSYHRFSDTRTMLGISNFWNVMSNLPFLIIGIWGLHFLLSRSGHLACLRSEERWPYLVFFLGVALTCFGSSYYHLAPDNARLVWDRLPMTLGFMALFAAVIGERISLRFALRALPVFLVIGMATVFYWKWSELAGIGDLRPYLLVQFFPMLGIPMLFMLYPAMYTRTFDYLYVFGFYLLAKVLEAFDPQVLNATGGLMSGHAIKHVSAALAVWFVLRILQKRTPIASA